LSIVPNELLKPADSLDIPTFGTELLITAASQQIDIWTRHAAYWKKCIIRNTQLLDVLTYRLIPNGRLRSVKPNSELPIKGWSSWLQVLSGAAAPEGVVEFECARMEDAMKNARSR